MDGQYLYSKLALGFHSELTGRENIFLNGAILGMKRDEIKNKFDKIVEFSGIKKFLDTPVKRYSSGMSVRLAFSIAVNLEPEILLLDEVLAVGDAEFQKRCMVKMREVTEKSSRTIIFVSHNMASIRNLCNRCIWLNHGKIEMIGNSEKVISEYLQSEPDIEINSFNDLRQIISDLPEDPIFKLIKIELSQDGRSVLGNIVNGLPLEIKIKYQVRKSTAGLRVFVNLLDLDDNLIFRTFHDEKGNEVPTMEPGEYSSTAIIPANVFGPIDYKLCINAGIYNVRNLLPHGGICIPFKVGLTSDYNRAYSNDSFRGKLALSIKWDTKKL
jgi:lipopolysaccharide transport system ATP-binding protein